jgi:predicted O-linked N-acetylglucosamine transferase (SPINDLY family)
MGVPTLSLEGATPAGREGAAFLRHVGLQEFIARDKDDFIEKGMQWAQNTSRLAELRSSMRTRVQSSLLGHPEVIVAGLAKALRTMWRRWCAGLPPEAF